MSKKCKKSVDSIRLWVGDLVTHRGNKRKVNVSHLFILPIYSLLLTTIACGAHNRSLGCKLPYSSCHSTFFSVRRFSWEASKVETTLCDYCNLFANSFEAHFT